MLKSRPVEVALHGAAKTNYLFTLYRNWRECQVVGINPDFDYLYDPQQCRPVGFCPVCGGEIYRIGAELCATCDGFYMEDFET